MDTVGSNNNFVKQGEDFADKTAEKVQSGIRNAKETGTQAADQAKLIANQTMNTLSAATKQARATVSDVGDSLVSYTQDNPVKAILVAAAVGALIATLATALSSARD